MTNNVGIIRVNNEPSIDVSSWDATITDTSVNGIRVTNNDHLTIKVDNEEFSFTATDFKNLKKILRKTFPEDYI
jgi:hypothetical protein